MTDTKRVREERYGPCPACDSRAGMGHMTAFKRGKKKYLLFGERGAPYMQFTCIWCNFTWNLKVDL